MGLEQATRLLLPLGCMPSLQHMLPTCTEGVSQLWAQEPTPLLALLTC